MKNQSAIRLMLASNFIGNMAQGMTMISIPTYFSEQNLSNDFFAFYWVVTLITLIWTPFAGTIVDKYDRKKIFWIINAACFGILGLLYLWGIQRGEISPLAAGAAFAMTFFNYNIYYACFYSFIQEITPPKSYGKIASTIEMQGQFAAAIAGALAALLWEGKCFEDLGFCFPQISLNGILGLNAIVYAITFLLIGRMKYESLKEESTDLATDGTMQRLKTGYNWLKSNPYIFLFGALSFTAFLVVITSTFSLNAVYAKVHLGAGPSAYAWSEVTYAIGAVLAGALIVKIFSWTNNVKAIIILTLLTALQAFILAFTKSEWIFYIITFLMGITNAGVRVLRIEYLFTIVPNWVAGRANSIFAMTNILQRLIFLGIFTLPFFHIGNNLIWAFAILAIFTIFASLVMMLYYAKYPSKEMNKSVQKS